MEIGILILVLLSVLSFGSKKFLSGVSNAVFYAKGTQHRKHRLIKFFLRDDNNIHRIETPEWYAMAGMIAPLLYALFYTNIEAERDIISYGIPAILTLLLTMAGSALASPFYQGFINVANGRPFVDPEENKKSEFNFLGLFSRWWRRPLQGKGRFIVMGLGVVYIVISIVIINIFY